MAFGVRMGFCRGGLRVPLGMIYECDVPGLDPGARASGPGIIVFLEETGQGTLFTIRKSR